MKIVLTRESGYNGSLRTFTPPSAMTYEVPLTRTMYRSLVDVEAELEACEQFRSSGSSRRDESAQWRLRRIGHASLA